jgi:2-aminoethylphosphonate-pyruvate transaminase
MLMVDAMSSFGALPIDMARDGIDVLVSSSNKCIEGVPGFAYVLCRRDLLAASAGRCHSVALDLNANGRHWKRPASSASHRRPIRSSPLPKL